MKNSDFDFAAFLLDALGQYSAVSVPGLGVFSVWELSAKADHVSGVVLPPRVQFTFSTEEKEGAEVLTRLAAQQLKLSALEAQDLIGESVQAIWERLQRLEVVGLASIGALRMDIYGELKFESDFQYATPYTFGLYEIEATPLIRKSTEYQKPPGEDLLLNVPIASLHEPIGRRPHSWIYMLGGTLVIGAGIIWVVKMGADWKKEASSPELLSPPTDSRPAGSTAMVPDTIPATALLDSMVPASTVSPLDTTRAAVIVIGLFREPANVARLVQRIRESGFESYTSPEGSLTRVGISVSYMKEAELAGILEQVRATFEPGAFIWKK